MRNKIVQQLKLRIKSFEFRVSAIIFTAVLAVVAIGFTTYSSLTQIVSGVAQSTKQDGKLLLLKEILAEITDAESYAKSFTFTNDDKYLGPYARSIDVTHSKLKELKKLSTKDSSELVIDSLTLLVHRKFIVLNDFIALRDTGRLDVVLGILSDKINPGYSRNDRILSSKDKESLLNRIFNRRKKSKTNGAESGTVSSFKDMQQEIERLRFLEEVNAEEIARSQMELTEQDKVIMENIRKIFQDLETAERNKIAANTKAAELLAQKTNTNITAFSIGLTFILFLLGYVIVSNIKKSREYNLQLEKAKSETEQLAEAKELFVANMSHEIRTPLHAITGFTEQVMQSELQPEQREQMEIIKKSGDHLLKLVNNVLDLTKIHAGKLVEFKDVFLPKELLSDTLNLIAPLAKEKNLGIHSIISNKIPEKLVGDVIKFRQVLLNILSNAVKFTEAGSISLTAGIRDQSNGMVTLEVKISDTGIGISEDQMGTIFDEFVQVSNKSSMKYGGTGLGLSISRKLTEFMGGKLSIESTRGVGSTITIDIPFTVNLKEKAQVIPDKIIDTSEIKNKRILVADDEVFNVKLLNVLLQKWQIQFTSVSNGRDVLQALSTNSYDAVLMDLTMPVMNGYDTARNIRENPDKRISNLPIIALTASAEPEVAEHCKNAGIYFLLIKPYLESDLLETLKLAIRGDLPKQQPRKQVQTETLKNNTNIASYDLKGLKAMAPNDPDFVRDMLETFIQSTGNNLELMWKALRVGDAHRIAELAHTMIPPCRHLGMFVAVDLLKNAETLAKEDKIENTLIGEIEKLDALLKKSFVLLREEISVISDIRA
ncbi:MAG: response regulator [Bacteroidetes bacterium]|nr:response regulator [Bacteroidota bacterium]